MFLMGVLYITIFIITILGFAFCIKSTKEPNSFKKVFSLISNTFLFLAILVVFISNGIDIYKALT